MPKGQDVYKRQALDYAKWENFAKVIKRAMIACENSGHSIPDDFPEVRKIVEAGDVYKRQMRWKRSYQILYINYQIDFLKTIWSAGRFL